MLYLMTNFGAINSEQETATNVCLLFPEKFE